MSEPTFHEFTSTEILPAEFVFYRNSVHVLTDKGKVVFKNHALSELLRVVGFTKTEFRKLNDADKAEVIRTALEKGLVIGVVEVEPGIYVAFRVTTPEYTAVPHRVLFDFVKDFLARRYGIHVDPIIRRYKRRTVAFFPIYKKDVRVAEANDVIMAGIYVSNANTGRHSIKVYMYIEVLACSNGAILKNVGGRVRILHVRSIEQILQRVANAVENIMDWLKRRVNDLIADLERLAEEELTEDEIREWLEDIMEKLPKKYRKWFERVTMKYVKQYGRNKYALWQTLTYFAPRLERVNEDLAHRLNSMAVKMVIPATRRHRR